MPRKKKASTPEAVRPGGKVSDVTDGGGFVGEELDGARIKNGEAIRVTWPDGTSETVRAIVEQNGVETMRAQAAVDYHGAAARVLLCRAQAARRVNPPCTCNDGTCAVCEARWKSAPRKRASQ